MIDNPNNEVEEFIENTYKHFADSREQQEWFRVHNRYGYCYYFAHTLMTAFNRGTVCYVAPNSHFVWRDEDGKTYDVEGEYKDSYYYLIPEKYLPQFILDWFKFTKPIYDDISKESWIGVIKAYCCLTHQEYKPEIEKHL